MIKLKFFMDPITKIEPWLNSMAAKGYRLKALYLFIYVFEKVEEKVSYSTQYIGARPNKENRAYIEMLESLGNRTFRAPLNQGNLAFGKIRLRPYGKGISKVATSFDNYNKEILIVENLSRDALPLLTSNREISQQYRDQRNAYSQGLVLCFGFLLYLLWKVYSQGFTTISYFAIPLLFLLSLFLLVLVLGKHRLYQKYSQDARVVE